MVHTTTDTSKLKIFFIFRIKNKSRIILHEADIVIKYVLFYKIILKVTVFQKKKNQENLMDRYQVHTPTYPLTVGL